MSGSRATRGPAFPAQDATEPYKTLLSCIDAGALIRKRDARRGNLVAVMKVWAGSADVVRYVKMPANVQQHPLHRAVQRGNLGISCFFLAQGLDPRRKVDIFPVSGDEMLPDDASSYSCLELMSRINERGGDTFTLDEQVVISAQGHLPHANASNEDVEKARMAAVRFLRRLRAPFGLPDRNGQSMTASRGMPNSKLRPSWVWRVVSQRSVSAATSKTVST